MATEEVKKGDKLNIYHSDYTIEQMAAAIGKNPEPRLVDGVYYWFIWDIAAMEYVPTDVKAEGVDGEVTAAQLEAALATYSEVVTEQMRGKADLVDGKVPQEQLPDDLGGGLLPQVIVTTSPGASVTATIGGTTVGPVVADAEGVATLELTDYGEWTVSAELNGETVTVTLDVTDVMQYAVTLSFGPLPAGFTQLEYLQTDGKSYIDTGLISGSSGGFTIITSVYVPSATATSWFFGGSKGASYHRNLLGVTPTWAFWTPTGSWTGGTVTSNTRYNIAATITGSPSLTVDGSTVKLTHNVDRSEGQHVGTWFLFAINEATIAYASSGFRIYDSARIYTDAAMTNLVAELYPARRNGDSMIGMYDLVTNTFFLNAGTGNFIAGPEV